MPSRVGQRMAART